MAVRRNRAGDGVIVKGTGLDRDAEIMVQVYPGGAARGGEATVSVMAAPGTFPISVSVDREAALALADELRKVAGDA